MASNLLLIVFLVLLSPSLTSVYSLSPRDSVSKQDDESYFMLTTSDQGLSMIDVEDLAKARSLQSLVGGSKVDVNKAVPKRSPKKSEKGPKKKKTSTTKNVGSLMPRKMKIGSLYISALVGIIIIIVAILVTILIIICAICFFCVRHKPKKVQSIGEEQIKESSETHTMKTEDHV